MGGQTVMRQLLRENKDLAPRVRDVQLLGEIDMGESEAKGLLSVLRQSMLFGATPDRVLENAPHVIAVLMVRAAREHSDGMRVWPAIKAGLPNWSESQLGPWFEGYLVRNHLPTFDRLIELDNAQPHRTRLLLHALVPQPVVSEYMEKVIWPAVSHGGIMEFTGADVQQRLLRTPPSGMPQVLLRFLKEGGAVARDVVGRSIALAAATADGTGLPNSGLPGWMHHEIVEWVNQLTTGKARKRSPTVRIRPPRLKLDLGWRRVVLHLPFQDAAPTGAFAWEVILPGEPGIVRRDATSPQWARTGPAEEVEVESPVASASVTLVSSDPATGGKSWSLPILDMSTGGVFFSHRDLSVVRPGSGLSGRSWYVLRPADSTIETDPPDAVKVLETHGLMAGSWGEYECDLVEVPNRVRRLRIMSPDGPFAWLHLAGESDRARMDVPPLPPFLASNTDAILGVEHSVPKVLLPLRRSEDRDSSYPRIWTMTATCEESGESHSMTAHGLRATYDATSECWSVPLEPLIPAEDVGHWRIDAQGPLGMGQTFSLALLPHLEFDVPESMEIGGAAAAARTVRVRTESNIRVLEEADAAAESDGLWDLTDRNRNGLIPFSVEDIRTGRTTSAVISLPTVRWKWVAAGHDGSDFTPIEFQSESPDVSNARLDVMVPATMPVRLILESAGTQVQSEFSYSNGACAFPLARFQTTMQAEAGKEMLFVLEVSPQDLPAKRAVVGVVPGAQSDIRPRVDLDGNDAIAEWPNTGVMHYLSAVAVPTIRPWTGAVEAQISESDGTCTARFDGLAMFPGWYRVRFRRRHPWLGHVTEVEKTMQIGSIRDLAQRISWLKSSGIRGNLEPDVELSLIEAVMGDTPRFRAGKTALRVRPADVGDVPELLSRAIRAPLPLPWLKLPWWELSDEINSDGDPGVVGEFLASLSQSPPSASLRAFLGGLGMIRWRTLWRARNSLPEDTRRLLWAHSPVLGAVVELQRAVEGDESSAGRCLDALGLETLSPSLAEMKFLIGDASQPPRNTIARPGTVPLLSSAEWESGLAELAQHAAAPFVLPSFAVAAFGVDAVVERVSGWNPMTARAPRPGGPVASFARLSLSVAFSDRLIARGHLPASTLTAEAQAFCNRVMPRMFQRDVCLAELTLARRPN